MVTQKATALDLSNVSNVLKNETIQRAEKPHNLCGINHPAISVRVRYIELTKLKETTSLYVISQMRPTIGSNLPRHQNTICTHISVSYTHLVTKMQYHTETNNCRIKSQKKV